MFMEERLNEILELLKKDNKVLVKDLSIKFNVTESMIRKDLNKLEKEGLVERTYGGAILPRGIAETTSISNRLIKNIDTKKEIALKAFNSIEDKDTIFLDISSTNYLLAELLSKSTKKITLVTNMVEISSLFNNADLNIDLICIGGLYNKALGGVTGSEAIESISKYRFNKAFIGSCGINIFDKSICNFDLEEGNTKKAIIASSNKVYLLIENKKFHFDGTYKFASLSQIDYIITEILPDNKIIKLMNKLNISII
ncbi:DeoR/GlpR family DNA-binding transcription regulator [Eubacterium multiforme]|uniref:DeoR/GlpR family transcriptional regulator of sugar metabolism n=1 Tax=Eubacterium multiforme TaxID=83339 RepID=A0ABT9UU72_9FIRM|nr:DeoR/GlpR family DNA-binding transcription regulator [Eubacterium multiforme]MDQ0149865.1 DeoR/GlpR family transcriptional regulator of sugar metabolism [Eubacterium multiforme]